MAAVFPTVTVEEHKREKREEYDSLVLRYGGVVALKQRLNKEAESSDHTYQDTSPQEQAVNPHCYILPVLDDLQIQKLSTFFTCL